MSRPLFKITIFWRASKIVHARARTSTHGKFRNISFTRVRKRKQKKKKKYTQKQRNDYYECCIIGIFGLSEYLWAALPL